MNFASKKKYLYFLINICIRMQMFLLDMLAKLITKKNTVKKQND